MGDCSVLQQKRKARQFFMALIFIAILILGWYYPWLGYFIPLCMLLGIIIGLWRGRSWCDWYCPRGSFYDALIKSISPSKEIPALLKNIYFRLGIVIMLLAVMAFNLVQRWPDTYRIGKFFVVLITVTTILGVILAMIFHPRSWCAFCPIGTTVNLISRNKCNLNINSDLCIECKLCFKVCPIQIKPYLFKNKGIQLVKDSDCFKCGLCVAICPSKALNLNP